MDLIKIAIYFGCYQFGNKTLKDKAVYRMCKQEGIYIGGTTN